MSTAARQLYLTINGGSSSIKFAVFEAGGDPNQILNGQIERVGHPDASISATGLGDRVDKQPITAADHTAGATELITWLNTRLGDRTLAAIGHRVVQGGLRLIDHAVVDSRVLDELKKAISLDSAHLPTEIELIEAFATQYPDVPQVVCFDTAFHRDLPTVAKMLPIPRRYFLAGVHRFGFHGLSYAYLTRELQRIDPAVANGRVILAHLGSGASLAAIKNGNVIDTTMAFTPTAGLVMGTRPGDLDPGLLVYLQRSEKMTADQLDQMINKQCGMLGVSETSGDLRDLLARRATDTRAADAVALFCYQAKKYIGSFAAALGGLDALVFAGGIGEHNPEARAEICSGLEFLGIEINSNANTAGDSVISAARVVVRVIPTDEQVMIARAIHSLLQ